MTPMQAGHEACEEYGIPHHELHHHRGRGKLSSPWDDLLLVSTIPVTKEVHDQAHLHNGKDWAFSEWLKTAHRDELIVMIHAMHRQIDILRLWKDVAKEDRP